MTSAPIAESGVDLSVAFGSLLHKDRLNRAPDVLNTIANLSSDEVFTPPEFANRMLDTISEAWARDHNGESIWARNDVTFLDPATKSGVFLREIVKRIVEANGNPPEGSAERKALVDHVLTRQVFGIGMTQLTSLLARRSIYCSKSAISEHSVAPSFTRDWGNVWFERTEHTWSRGTPTREVDPLTGDEILLYPTCAFCPATRTNYERGDDLETHAYAFIHSDDPQDLVAKLFGADMHFDVIVGNPPYQLSDGGGAGTSAMPLYHRFVEQAMKLQPKYLSMVIKANWYSGGKGLDNFRTSMLKDQRIRKLVDFPDSREAFSGVDIAGGVMYFLWDRDHPGTCEVETVSGGSSFTAQRALDEYEVFVRDNRVLEIAKKVASHGDGSFSTLVSARRPFGIDAAHDHDTTGDLYLYASGGDGRISRKDVSGGAALIDAWKVLLSKTSSEHAGQTDKSGRRRVLSRIEVMPPASVSTESYLVVGPFASQEEAERVASYLRTRFVRFLVSAILLTQNITRGSFAFVPAQTFDREWDDAALYEKYGLTSDEITFIESTIKPMEDAIAPKSKD